MKSIKRYIQEKYLIDFDTHAIDINDCFQNREPDFIANSANDLSKFDSNIDKRMINSILSYTTNELYVWKCKYKTNSDKILVADASQHRRQKTGYFEITHKCDIKNCANDKLYGMICVDKKNKLVPEIWIINREEYCLYIEPQNEGA